MENVEQSLAEIREAAKEYYARKAGTWKPRRDLDAERLEDEARFRREAFIPSHWMDRYSSGPVKMLTIRPRSDYESIEKIRRAFEFFEMSALESTMKEVVEKIRRESVLDTVILDELPTSSPIPPSMKDLKEYRHKFLYGDWNSWSDSKVKTGVGKNPMAEHTIRGVKKSHRKRRFSKKSC